MFLGLKLLLLLLISPFVIWMFLYGIKKKSKFIGKVILTIYGIGFGLIVIITIATILGKKKVLEKEDFYGHYIIDRNYFPGKQADWQYNNFRFEIKENDSLYLYVTDGQKIKDTHKGKISILAPYKSARLMIKMEKPIHHIMTTSPTIYRGTWDFFVVFNSPKFSNMYFRRGKWTEID